MASAGTGYKLSLGADGPPGSYEDFDHADVFFVIGANMADCHPILFLRMMDRVKAGREADRRRPAPHRHRRQGRPVPADQAGHRPGAAQRPAAPAGRGRPHRRGRSSPSTPRAGRRCRRSSPTTRRRRSPRSPASRRPTSAQAARWIGEAGEWMSCWTMGLNQTTHGTWNTNALVNLHLATGAICRPGSGPFSLTGQPNAMGGREMGYMGPGLPGQRSVLVDGRTGRSSRSCGACRPARCAPRSARAPSRCSSGWPTGEIKACWIICTNPVASVANRRTVIAGLEAAELVITQDVFAETETNAYADVVLPAALWAETDGVMINSERNLTLLQQAVDPPGEALPDWQLIARVACAMGYARRVHLRQRRGGLRGDQAVLEPADRLRPARRQLRAAARDARCSGRRRARTAPRPQPDPLPQRRRQPAPARAPDGTRPRLAFATASGRAVFFARPHLPAAETARRRLPVRAQHRPPAAPVAHADQDRQGRQAQQAQPRPVRRDPPATTRRALGIADGDPVEVASRRGRAVLPAVVTDRVLPGNCFAPFHWNDLFGEYLSVNAVTNDAVDPISFQPEFKVCAVALAEGRRRPGRQPGRPAGTARRLAAGCRRGGARRRDRSPTAVHALAGSSGSTDLAPPVARRAASAATSPASSPGSPPRRPPGACPCCRRTRRSTRARAVGQRGARRHVLAYGTGRAARPAPDRAGRRPARPTRGRRPVGLADRQRRGVRRRRRRAARRGGLAGPTLRRHGRRAAGRPAGRRRRPARRSPAPSATATPPTTAPAFWDALAAPGRRPGSTASATPCSPSATPATTTSAATAAASTTGSTSSARIRLAARVGLRARLRATPRRRSWLGPGRHAALTQPPRPGCPPPAARRRGRTSAGYTRPARPRHRSARRQPAAEPARLGEGGAPVHLRHRRRRARRTRPATRSACWPANCPDLVAEWLAVTGLDPRRARRPAGDGDACPSPRRCAATSTSPGSPRTCCASSPSATGDRELKTLLRPDNKDELAKWTWGRQAVDVVAEYPVRAGAQEWAGVLKRLQPRLYSISSSPLARPAPRSA